MRRNAFIGHPRPTPDVNKADDHEELVMDEIRAARYTLGIFSHKPEQETENNPINEQEPMLSSK